MNQHLSFDLADQVASLYQTSKQEDIVLPFDVKNKKFEWLRTFY